jgi:murein L,D-transpeptidase YafK
VKESHGDRPRAVLAEVKRHLPVCFALAGLLPVPLLAGDFPPTSAHSVNGHRVTMPARATDTTSQEEMLLRETFDALQLGQSRRALESIEKLVARRPNYRLAQLIYADILLGQSRPLDSFGAADGASAVKVAKLQDEARMRIRHGFTEHGVESLPSPFLKLSESQKRAILIDVSESRLYLFTNVDGEARLTSDYYVSTGRNGTRKERQGDRRTPIGVYFIIGRIGASMLPDFYGYGALPVDYPNAWDRRLGRTGYGIWIHGVPSGVYSRAPRASDGCVALTNDDLNSTPVILVDGVTWKSRDVLVGRSEAFLSRLDGWRRASQDGDLQAYADHYSRTFRIDDRRYEAWLRDKRRLGIHAGAVEIGLSDVSLFAYPGDDNMLVATFTENQRTGNMGNRMRKRQYWRLEEDGEWRILYEGIIRIRNEHLRGIPYWARSEIFEPAP